MIGWVNRQVRIWWPALLAVIGGAILTTLGFVVTTVLDDRAQLREQRDLLLEQSDQLAQVIDRNRRTDAGTDRRLNDAIGDIESVLVDQFARHDENVALKLNDMLHRIAALLDRPAGTPPNPVNAVAPSPSHTGTAPAPSAAPAPRSAPTTTTPRTPAPTTTTTTQPGRSGLCDRIPTTPICRSPR